MFALLVSLHKASDLFTELTGGAVFTSMGAGDTESLSALPTPTPELIAKEQSKAKQGFCETYLWNCTDLCKYIKASTLLSALKSTSKSITFIDRQISVPFAKFASVFDV